MVCRSVFLYIVLLCEFSDNITNILYLFTSYSTIGLAFQDDN